MQHSPRSLRNFYKHRACTEVSENESEMAIQIKADIRAQVSLNQSKKIAQYAK